MQKSQLIIKIAQIVETLPPMPQNIDRILNTIRHNYVLNKNEIIHLTKEDPGLCADLLHIANESYDSFRNIDTIEDAVENIGVQPLIQQIGYCYARSTIREHFESLENLHQYFAHSRNISKSCRIIAMVSNMKPHDQQIYATAGLIHDIGRLVVVLASNRFNASLLGTTAEKMSYIDHDEKKIMGLSHSQVGWRICRRWKFSPVLQEAVLRHHTPILNDDFSFPGGMVFIAHFVSYSDFSGEILSKMLPAELLTNLNLTIKDFIEARKLARTEPY